MEEENQQPIGTWSIKQSHRRWVLFGFLLFAIVTIFVGIFSVADGLFGETIERRKKALAALQEREFDFSHLLDAHQARRMEIIEQKQLDTDSDGINDYDEENVYGTSAYLADTDSDGQSDLDEIRQGSNPLCDDGKVNCFQPTEEVVSIADEELLEQQRQQEEVEKAIAEIQENISREDIRGKLEAELEPDNVRRLLVRARFNPEAIAAFTDEEILGIRDDILNNSFGAIQAANVDEKFVDQSVLSLDPPQLRELLAESGIPPEAISLFDDQALQRLYFETITDLAVQQADPAVLQQEVISGESTVPTP